MKLDENETVTIVRGRTPISKNLLHLGFRYSKDSKLMKDGRQAWRCIKRDQKCKGRLYTLEGHFHSTGQVHVHVADPADCEVREALSKVQDLATSSTSSNKHIYSVTTETLSDEARSLLPSEGAIRKKAQRARRKEREGTIQEPYKSTQYLKYKIARDLATSRYKMVKFAFSDDLMKELSEKTALNSVNE